MLFYLLIELDLVRQCVSQSPEAVLNELFELAAGELVELQLVVSTRAPGDDR